MLVMISCNKEGDLFKNPPAKDLNITFQNTLTPTDDLNILDYLYFYNGGGIAIGDINNDGLQDIYFSGNQVKNQLYLNKGNLKFENITESAGVAGNSDWNTGAVMGDVNGDGLLDLYVCAVVGINGLNGHNELYINNGDNTFTESAAAYNLDADSYSSSAAFLDYDLDGDLDIYILNHAVHTQRSFGKADLRNTRNYQTGDKLMRNDRGHFTDVSEETGIYGGINGYGLGIAISDFNMDGYPDIYVGNDFHEDDYYYLNNGDGTFSEKLRENFGHTSRFSMGSDVADLNHDGWPDLISLDMLPEDEKVLKTSEGDDNIQTQRLRTENYGYYYQYTRNMLYVNQPGYGFRESALLSGVAATDWSWSALFGDYDQDGEQDLFISNGIPKRPNDLDYIRFVSSGQIQQKLDKTKLIDRKALDRMPSGNAHNYIFRGDGKLNFTDESGKWILNDTLISGATAYADLDNDGDLDIVTNNIDAPPAFYINKTDKKAHYLQVKLDGTGNNRFGVGAKVYAYANGITQFKEMYSVRGFQASSQPLVHFGFGASEKIDSLLVIWPDRTSQTLYDIKADQVVSLSQFPAGTAPKGIKPFDYSTLRPKSTRLFEKVAGNLGINFTHQEDRYSDFDRQKLIPYQISDRGPAVAIGDLNCDGKEDVFFGGSKFIPSQLFIQKDSVFQLYGEKYTAMAKDSITEDVTAVIADFSGNGDNRLLIGTGGGDFSSPAPPLADSYYSFKDSVFTREIFPEIFENTSIIIPYDYDGDGDLDIFLGNQAVTGDFGKLPKSYLLKNNNGNFEIDQEFTDLGMVTDAVWDDFDGDGIKDLIVVGEWMEPVFMRNNGGKLVKTAAFAGDLSGLWQSIIPFDIDGDGDTDYLLGNWGENSKFKASAKAPMLMYYADFDNNGQTETIVTTAKNGKNYPLLGLDALSSQVVSLRKKYTSYKDFAGRTVEEIFGEKQLKNAKEFQVNTLKSGYLKNNSGKFEFVPFNDEMQIAPIMAFCTFDFDGDGSEEVLAAGNYFGVQPFHGRMDSFTGALIKDDKTILQGYTLGLDFARKSIRHLNVFTFNKKNYLLTTFNNAEAEVYELKR